LAVSASSRHVFASAVLTKVRSASSSPRSALCLASRNHLTVFAERDPWGVDIHPTPPTRVPLTTPPFRHTADRVTKSGRKTQRAQGGGLFNKSWCAALRPMFVGASSSAPPRAGLLMAETRLRTSPLEKPIPIWGARFA
jgi:hypothetical protein